MLISFITAKNQEEDSRFLSFAGKNHINSALRIYQPVSTFAHIQVSLYNSHDTECAVKIKELLRNIWNYN